jgi:hypothetical protein
MRWWSGEGWTEHQQPLAPAPPVAPEATADVAPYVPMSDFAVQSTAGTATGVPRLTGRAARVENERQARKNNIFAWLGLLFAVIGALFNPFGLVSVVAVIFASVGLARAQRLQDAGAQFTGRGTAIAGLVVGIIGLALFVTRLYFALQNTGF